MDTLKMKAVKSKPNFTLNFWKVPAGASYGYIWAISTNDGPEFDGEFKKQADMAMIEYLCEEGYFYEADLIKAP